MSHLGLEKQFHEGGNQLTEYGELMSLAEANLKAKGIVENYRMVGNLEREGAETNFVGRFNLVFHFEDSK